MQTLARNVVLIVRSSKRLRGTKTFFYFMVNLWSLSTCVKQPLVELGLWFFVCIFFKLAKDAKRPYSNPDAFKMCVCACVRVCVCVCVWRALHARARSVVFLRGSSRQIRQTQVAQREDRLDQDRKSETNQRDSFRRGRLQIMGRMFMRGEQGCQKNERTLGFFPLFFLFTDAIAVSFEERAF